MSTRITGKDRRVIQAIHTLEQPWGRTISQHTDLGSSTVYQILNRLLDAGWITGTRQDTQPPITTYQLTEHGLAAAGLELTDQVKRYTMPLDATQPKEQ